MADAHVEVSEDGEPKIAGRRIPVLTVVLKIGGTDTTIGQFAEGYELDVGDVRAALCWASTREDWMLSLIEGRSLRMRDADVDVDCPEGVDPSGIGEEDVADFRRRALAALSEIVRDCQQYSDTRWLDEE